MIEELNGIHEIVKFKEEFKFLIYENKEVEDYPSHWHIPIEIVMPIENTYTAIFEEITYELHEKDILLVSPGVIHGYKAPPYGKRIFIQIEIPSFFQMMGKEIDSGVLSPVLLISQTNSPHIYSLVYSHIMRICKEYKKREPLMEAVIYSSFMEILALIRRNTKESACIENQLNSKQVIYANKFWMICNYIDLHFTDKITLEEVADMAGFSKYHFARLFKEFTSHSFYQYVTQRRIQYASRLLLYPHLSITEIAMDCGFTNLSTFTRMFKIIKQCSPTEYRNIHNKTENKMEEIICFN